MANRTIQLGPESTQWGISSWGAGQYGLGDNLSSLPDISTAVNTAKTVVNATPASNALTTSVDSVGITNTQNLVGFALSSNLDSVAKTILPNVDGINLTASTSNVYLSVAYELTGVSLSTAQGSAVSQIRPVITGFDLTNALGTADVIIGTIVYPQGHELISNGSSSNPYVAGTPNGIELAANVVDVVPKTAKLLEGNAVTTSVGQVNQALVIELDSLLLIDYLGQGWVSSRDSYVSWTEIDVPSDEDWIEVPVFENEHW